MPTKDLQLMPTRRVFQGFTLVELLIVISIIGTLVAMLLPAINSARERGRQTVCSGLLARCTWG
jgi:prepilin-type N-terminal cleavage/methylation domain-containing protein